MAAKKFRFYLTLKNINSIANFKLKNAGGVYKDTKKINGKTNKEFFMKKSANLDK